MRMDWEVSEAEPVRKIDVKQISIRVCEGGTGACWPYQKHLNTQSAINTLDWCGSCWCETSLSVHADNSIVHTTGEMTDCDADISTLYMFLFLYGAPADHK